MLASKAIFAPPWSQEWQHEANKLWGTAHTLIGLWIHSGNDETLLYKSYQELWVSSAKNSARIKKLCLFYSDGAVHAGGQTWQGLKPEHFFPSLKLLTAWSSRLWQTILSMQSKQKALSSSLKQDSYCIENFLSNFRIQIEIRKQNLKYCTRKLNHKSGHKC